MNKIFEFVLHHWLLVSAFMIAFVWLIIEESRYQGLGGARQTPQGVTNLINRDDAVVVDLRDIDVFKLGHITGSINIPYAQLEKSTVKIDKFKQRPVVLVCAMGQQSLKFMHKLQKAGFEKVYVLAGGLSAWKRDNLPLMNK